MTVKLALNVEEAAAAVGVGKDTILAAIRSGHLRAKRSGKSKKEGHEGEGAGKYLIPVDSLSAWLLQLEDA